MSNSPGDGTSNEFDAAAEKASTRSARRHVGEAGFGQVNALEQIISAGREQIEVTQALREVVLSTQAQLRTLPHRNVSEEAQVHIKALEDIVSKAQKQIEAASELRRSIQQTLTNVIGTPVEDVSSKVLNHLSVLVQQQEAVLSDIIAAAVSEADADKQMDKLEQLDKEATVRLENVAQDRTNQEIERLNLLREQALEQIHKLQSNQ